MGCHSSRNNRVEPTSKPRRPTITHEAGNLEQTTVDGKLIVKTIRELRQFFRDVDDVHVILGDQTITDYDTPLTADMRVLDSYKNPYVYPPQPAPNHLLCDAPLPMGYIIYVVLQGVRKAYVYQFPNATSPGEHLTVSPYLESTSVPGGMVLCKDPTNPDSSEEFLWNQEGPDQVYKIYKEQTDGTKMYWQYNGDGAIVTLVKNNAQALSVRLNFKAP